MRRSLRVWAGLLWAYAADGLRRDVTESLNTGLRRHIGLSELGANPLQVRFTVCMGGVGTGLGCHVVGATANFGGISWTVMPF